MTEYKEAKNTQDSFEGEEDSFTASLSQCPSVHKHMEGMIGGNT
jgi:hypothetical protein